MPKIKAARKSTRIDMTPMVDVAFLLITFFMLTIKFRPQEAIQVELPFSIAETPLPERNMAIIKIGKQGQVFFGIDSKFDRIEMLRKMANRYQIEFTEEQEERFALLPEVGVAMSQLPQYLDIDPLERDEVNKTLRGIPVDSAHNELRDWIVAARLTNPKLRFAIKADKDTPYPVVKRVIETLREKKINRFYLITNLEGVEK